MVERKERKRKGVEEWTLMMEGEGKEGKAGKWTMVKGGERGQAGIGECGEDG